MADVEEKSVQDELSLPILLADRLIKSAQVAESSKSDCAELAKQADRLSQKLRSAVRLSVSSTPHSLYDRPLRRISADVYKNLERALTLVRKCKHSGVLRQVGHPAVQVFAIAATADFRKVSGLLESSIADVTWLLSIFENSDSGGGATLSLPPIASNDPILAMLWSSIASVQMGQLRDRIDAANNLASLARDNDRNKKMIVEEGGVVPLLKLLKEGASAEAQIAAAAALSNLGSDQERVRFIAGELAEEFGRENVTRPLVTLLSIDTVLDDPIPKLQPGKPSLHSLVQINKELARDSFNHIPHSSSSSLHKKERGVESPELKLELKISCARALWKLSRGSLLNSRKITETKGLLVLAKLIEKESGKLQSNCLMAVMELAAVAESNTDLRRVAFKPNSPAAKAVLEQILRVVNEESSLTLLISAIRSIGSLARTFPAKESRIIGPLVAQLGHRNIDVASEAAVALGKFACPDNFNCLEHSKAIIDADGVSQLMNLIRISGRDQVNELVLLCFLALNVGNSKALEQARALSVIEGAARTVVAQHPDRRELFAKAIHHLTLYQAGVHTHRQAFAP
ncbi:hypothetical protein RHGRI_024405 [Rhododendron griersonianum]|uniref:DUF7792 domain-containing protein n=1 Tax=Rhododendron griersonianum TaxID=479676 RepID=A0AAV6JCB3_9ERIC|nr:hypothetical protein RHGRI_024405 [Rhododendron griersonianum]